MASRSQHTLQIMEHTTQFDLNGSLQKWSEELAAQPVLTPEARSELETHWQETVKDLLQPLVSMRRSHFGWRVAASDNLANWGRNLPRIIPRQSGRDGRCGLLPPCWRCE